MTTPATEYTIVHENVKSDLILEVNKLLKEGWHLLGGVQFVDSMFTQSLVKNEN
jgi:hypothetical protein